MNYREEISQFVVENFLLGSLENFNQADSYFVSGKIKFDGFLELISFLEERFDVFFRDDELIPENFDNLDKIINNLKLKTSGETN
jgi:acyl carrier protein